MSIEIVKLKNGDEYPLSPAYRTPIVAEVPLEYPFAYDLEAEGTGSLTLVTEFNGQEVARNEFTLFPLTSRVQTSDELAAISARGESMLGEFVIEDAAVMDTNTLVDMFMLLNGVSMNDSFGGLPGSIAAMSIGQEVFTIASLGSAVTPGASDTESGETTIDGQTVSVDVTATVTVPEAGTYWSTTVPSNMLAGLQGEVSACTYQLDPRYYGGGIMKICNWLLAAQLLEGQAVSLLAFPRVEEKLLAAARRGIPLAIWLGMAYQMGVGGEQFNGSAGYQWALANGGTLTFNASAHTLVYTAGS